MHGQGGRACRGAAGRIGALGRALWRDALCDARRRCRSPPPGSSSARSVTGECRSSERVRPAVMPVQLPSEKRVRHAAASARTSATPRLEADRQAGRCAAAGHDEDGLPSQRERCHEAQWRSRALGCSGSERGHVAQAWAGHGLHRHDEDVDVAEEQGDAGAKTFALGQGGDEIDGTQRPSMLNGAAQRWSCSRARLGNVSLWAWAAPTLHKVHHANVASSMPSSRFSTMRALARQRHQGRLDCLCRRGIGLCR